MNWRNNFSNPWTVMKCHICPYSRGLKKVGRIWPTRTFCATHVLFGNFQISNIYVAKCLKKRCREIIQSNLNDTQCGFRPGRSNTESHILLSSKIFRNLGACQRHLHMLCCPQESIRLGSSWKALWSVARIRCWRLPVTGHQVTVHQVTVRVSVSGELNHDYSPLVLESEKGVCCHRSFS